MSWFDRAHHDRITIGQLTKAFFTGRSNLSEKRESGRKIAIPGFASF
jgi:hypothetical protein